MIIIIIIIILIQIIIIIIKGVSPPLLVRCHNHSCSVVLAGPRVAPLRMRGVAWDAIAEASMFSTDNGWKHSASSSSSPLLPPPPHPANLHSYSFLFPPWRIPYNPPRDPPSPLSSFPFRFFIPSYLPVDLFMNISLMPSVHDQGSIMPTRTNERSRSCGVLGVSSPSAINPSPLLYGSCALSCSFVTLLIHRHTQRPFSLSGVSCPPGPNRNCMATSIVHLATLGAYARNRWHNLTRLRHL